MLARAGACPPHSNAEASDARGEPYRAVRRGLPLFACPIRDVVHALEPASRKTHNWPWRPSSFTPLQRPPAGLRPGEGAVTGRQGGLPGGADWLSRSAQRTAPPGGR